MKNATKLSVRKIKKKIPANDFTKHTCATSIVNFTTTPKKHPVSNFKVYCRELQFFGQVMQIADV